MKISIKATGFTLTPSIKAYAEDKLGSLGKFIKRFDLGGVAEMWVEVGKVTQHHHKGPVFRAEADLRLPQRVLRAEEKSTDLRVAIDIVEQELQAQIKKYKARFEKGRRSLRKTKEK